MSVKHLLILALVTVSASSFSQVKSDFTASDEGWKVWDNSGNIYPISYSATGGNPGGEVSYTTSGANPFYYFQAPAKFLTDLRSSYGQTLTFDINVNQAGSDLTYSDIIMYGGAYMYYVMPAKPAAGVWTSYSLLLSEAASGWHYNSPTGPSPTKQQWKAALSNMQQFKIRLKYLAGGTSYTGLLDNVVFNTSTYKTPPSITAISALSGIPNVTNVTITGNNFNATAAQNAVFFGGIKGSIVSGSATSVTAKVPAGAKFGFIKVLDLSTGLAAESVQNFSPEFNNNNDIGGRIIPASFGNAVGLAVDAASLNSQQFAIGDIDGDGGIDIVFTEMNIPQLSFFRNLNVAGPITTASFAAKFSMPLAYGGANGNTLMTDFDGDGKPDVLVGVQQGGAAAIAIFRNTSVAGTISFAPVEYITASSYADGPLAAADIDGDGRPEILSTFSNSAGGANAYFTVFPNMSTPGDIEFSYYYDLDYNVIGQSTQISPGDLDGDGKVDVAVIDGFDGSIIVMRNTSTVGSFSFETPFTVATGNPHYALVADIDNDGKMDLTYNGYSTGSSLYIKKNLATAGILTTASFAAPVSFGSQVFANGGRVGIGDFNGDQKPDVILAASPDIAVFENNSTTGIIDATSLLESAPFITGGNTGFTFSADFNGDGKLDIITNQIGGTAPYHMLIYENQCYPAPTVTSAVPVSGAAGATITLSGNNMATGPAGQAAIVRAGELLATTTSTTQTSTVVKIPVGAKSDRWSVSVHGLVAQSPVIPITFPTSRVIDATSLAPPVSFTLSSNVNNTVMLADFDDDGKVDVGVVDNYHTGKIFQNSHAAAGQAISAASLTQISTTFNAYPSLAAFDIDGDGKLDITSGNGMYRNKSTPGTISFPTAPVGTNETTNITVAASGDFNNDGKIDLAGIFVNSNVYIYENRSTAGDFRANPYYSVNITAALLARGTGNGSIVSADLDGDGNLDLATANAATNNWSYFRNLGIKGMITTASFAARVDIASGVGAFGITASDFDGDGKVDIAIANNGDLFVSVFKNTSTPGSISFAPMVTFPCVTKSFDLASQDIDGDGKDEIIIIHQNTPGSLSILQNTSSPGTISFGTAVNFPSTHTPLQLGIADINQDNKPDVVVVSNVLQVYQNLIPAALITITQQPADVIGCLNTTASFSVAATGTTNITYQWQKTLISPVNFTDITDGSGITGSATAKLTIDMTVATAPQNFRYRAKVSGDLSPSIFSNDAGLTAHLAPASAPGVRDTVICTEHSVVLTATGADDGLFRWYQNATDITAIAGETKSTYTTPTLQSSTDYYVSISNGTCESPRVAVHVTVNNCDNSPVIATESVPVAIGGRIAIFLPDIISDPDNDVDFGTLKIVSQPTDGVVVTIDNEDSLIVDYSASKFAGIDKISIQVCDLADHCATQMIQIEVTGALIVYNGVSPDGNGKNDKWIIKYIEALDDTRDNHVVIFDRWGDKVFDIDNYDNTSHVFTGQKTSGGDLPSGTYFYKISFVSGRKTMTGYLSLKRN